MSMQGRVYEDAQAACGLQARDDGGAEMTNYDLSRLRELAEKATPGPWVADRFIVISPKDHYLARTYTHSDGNINRLELMDTHDNAAYIAAANPQIVIALIDMIKGLQRDLAKCLDKCGSLEKEANWLAATLARWDERFSLTGKPPKDAAFWRAEARKAVEEQK